MAVGDPVVIVAPTIVRYTFRNDMGNGKTADNVVDISLESSFTATRADAIADLHDDVIKAWQDKVVGPSWQYGNFVGAHWIDLHSADGETGELAPVAGHPITGTATGAMMAPNCCYLIHKNSTARRGQRQGRMYMVGVAEADADNLGRLTGAVVTSQTTRFEQFRSTIDAIASLSIESAAWRTVHVRKIEKLDPATWTWTSSTIDSVSCDPVIATQRRRMR